MHLRYLSLKQLLRLLVDNMKKNILKKLISRLFLFILIFSIPILTFAAGTTPTKTTAPKAFTDTINNLQNTAKNGGYSTKDVNEKTFAAFIGTVVQTVLGFVGVIFAILIIYGGVMWMTAGGNEGQVTKAKGIFKNSIIGLVIVLSAMLITNFINTLLKTL